MSFSKKIIVGFDIAISNEKETQCVDDKIIAFNRIHAPFTQDNHFVSLNFHIKNESGRVIAGINSLMYCWGMLYIDVLFVEDSYRDQNLGSLFLKKVETESKSMGATLCHLDTFDWQAKDFYLKHGYEMFGVLDGCPPGHKRYYMKKVL